MNKITLNDIKQKKVNGEKITMLTAYDYTFAKIVDEAKVDIILVGDSASSVMAGHQDTLPITLEQMIYHAQSVCRAVKHALVVVDLPFGTYHISPKQALKSAIRVIKETGAHAVKLEGGEEVIKAIQLITAAGIPVMGHLGLTPQSINQLGSYGVQGKDNKSAKLLEKSALLLEEKGNCFSIVLEKIPASIATSITQKSKIPTIGIGAGKNVDGQVLVLQDMLGLNKDFNPKFVRQYATLHDSIIKAVKNYCNDVYNSTFPNESESY